MDVSGKATPIRVLHLGIKTAAKARHNHARKDGGGVLPHEALQVSEEKGTF